MTTKLKAIAIVLLCAGPAFPATPLIDMGDSLYLDQFQGGLYPNGSNDSPLSHAVEGVSRSLVPPIDGKHVFLSVGMSNTTQEYARFMSLADAAPVNYSTLEIVDGALGSRVAEYWESPTAPSYLGQQNDYDRIRDNELATRGLNESQVQSIWLKVTNLAPTISLPNEDSSAYELFGRLGNIVRTFKVRYPNLEQVFLTSRIYGGYSETTRSPEPYAYEDAFAMKWLVEAQINQMDGLGIDPIAGDLDYTSGVAPWIGWGPYLWADGLNPRSDGLFWAQDDFQGTWNTGNPDGVHPSSTGRQKVAERLLDYFLESGFSRSWFRDQVPGDFNEDGSVDAADYVSWQASGGAQEQYLLWASTFGAGAQPPQTVPEPDVLILILTLLVPGAPLGPSRQQQQGRAGFK